MIGLQTNVRTVVLAIASIRREFTDAKIVVLAIVNMVKENNDVRIVMADRVRRLGHLPGKRCPRPKNRQEQRLDRMDNTLPHACYPCKAGVGGL